VPAPPGRDTADLLLASRACLFAAGAAAAGPVVVIASNDRRFAATLRFLGSRPGALAVAVTAPPPDRYHPGLPPDWRRHPLAREAGAAVAWRGGGASGGGSGGGGPKLFGEHVWVRRPAAAAAAEGRL
jgi:hypothetical protein